MNSNFVRNIHYRLYSLLNSFIPKKKNMIFIYDSQCMRQNCWVFFKYLIDNNYNKNYKIVYYCEKKLLNLEKYNPYIISNIFKGWWLYLRARFTFYEYHNFKFCCHPSHKQISVYLTHGMPLKNYGYMVSTPSHPYEEDYTYLLMTSSYYVPIMNKILGCKAEQVYLGGMPRNDLLLGKGFAGELVKDGMKNLIWMPTYRNSSNNNVSDSNIDIPIITKDNIEQLNIQLEKLKINLIIKLHPFQNQIQWLNNDYSNINVLYDKDLENKNVELYSLLSCVDGLLTDYSSVYSDFLLTNNPIFFVVDDLFDYKEKRGFVDDKLFEMLPGPIINNYDSLIKCLNFFNKLDEDYKRKRLEIKELLTPLPNNNSYSKDLCDFLGISSN